MYSGDILCIKVFCIESIWKGTGPDGFTDKSFQFKEEFITIPYNPFQRIEAEGIFLIAFYEELALTYIKTKQRHYKKITD